MFRTKIIIIRKICKIFWKKNQRQLKEQKSHRRWSSFFILKKRMLMNSTSKSQIS